jgi:hypothetical protein
VTHFKIINGTGKGDERPLCETCTRSHVIRGDRFEDSLTFCAAFSSGLIRVPFPVRQCSDYVRYGHMRIDEMEKIALDIKTDKRVRGMTPDESAK